MARLLLRALVFLASAALGLLAAQWLLDRFTLTASGFVTTVVVFALAQSLLSPVVASVADRYAKTLLGGVGLLSTFVALLVATLIDRGLSIRGVDTWLLATGVVWLVTAVTTLLLPLVSLRNQTSAKGRTDRVRGG